MQQLPTFLNSLSCNSCKQFYSGDKLNNHSPWVFKKCTLGVIGKTKSIEVIGFLTCIRLFQTRVCSVLDFAAKVWGHLRSENIHNWTIWYLLRAHKYAPISAVTLHMESVRFGLSGGGIWWGIMWKIIKSNIFKWINSIGFGHWTCMYCK